MERVNYLDPLSNPYVLVSSTNDTKLSTDNRIVSVSSQKKHETAGTKHDYAKRKGVIKPYHVNAGSKTFSPLAEVRRQKVDLHQLLGYVTKSLDALRLAESERKNILTRAAVSGSAVDTKGVDAIVSLVNDQFKMARATMRSIFGDQILRIQLPISLPVVASAGTVVDSVSPILPNTAVEFTALSSLFDEFKCISGKLLYLTETYSGLSTSNDSRLSIAYDPTDPAVATSHNGLAQLAQHHVSRVAVVAPSTGVVALNAPAVGSFPFHVPKGVLDENGSNAIGDAWQPTDTSAFLPYGYLKFYGTTFAASQRALSGTVYLHCLFRCRT